MKYYIMTYGCQMNESDSERIAAVLENAELSPAKTEDEADFIIINMCSVRKKSVDKVFKKISIIRAKNKKVKIALTGCILNRDKKKFKKMTDPIFRIDELQKLPKLLQHITENKRQTTHYLKIIPKYKKSNSAYIPIMTGCNNFCSYCVVPYTRGREVSRPDKDIISEIKKLLKKGKKTICLLGQNVNSYNYKQTTDNKQQKITFPRLLKKLEKLPGNFEITFLTSHPKDFSDELIKIIAKSEKIKKYIHLPVQAGSNKILKKMNRNYTREHYLKLIDKIKNTIPDVELSTDIIVGFPGEAKKDFKDTVDLVKEVKFSKAYINKYSPRPGTAAEKLKDNVVKKEKERREKILRSFFIKNKHDRT
ncbi:MAG: tRNA (N6-isopentenyl adenosine(37)-C2)-methylthiotransferase MiaB [Candidatus Pacebacteria bacterium]|nr:tRNA (N6-isopentenyl adenosine(37)-C2)-methylthiotransferase MiaB [Candidatus Paceibacterota bacterium]